MQRERWKIKGGWLAWDREKEHQRILMLWQKGNGETSLGPQGEVLLEGPPFTSATGHLQVSETGTSVAVPALARSL